MAVSRPRDYRETLRKIQTQPSAPAFTRRRIATAVTLAAVISGGFTVAGVAAHVSEAPPREVVAEVAPREVTPEVLAETEGQQVDIQATMSKAREKAKEPLPDFSKMSPSQLQVWAIRVQSEFVMASMAYEAAETQTAQAEAEAKAANKAAAAAATKADASKEEFAEHVIASSQDPLITNPGLMLITSTEDDPGKVIEDYTIAQQYTDLRAGMTTGLMEDSEEAEALSEEAAALREDARRQEKEAASLLADIQERASKVADATSAAFGTDAANAFASAEQAARNQAALKNWNAYLRSLRQAKVTPPKAKALSNPARLPAKMNPLVDADGKAVPGVAAVSHNNTSLTILPRETIAAVSTTFKRLDAPFVDGMAGPDAYDCVGLLTSTWESGGVKVRGEDPVDVYSHTRKVRLTNMQVGDLVFFSDGTGVQHVGLNLGGDMMLTSDASSMRVGVQQFPSEPFSAARVTLAPENVNKAPETDRSSYSRCAGQEPGAAGTSMAYPLKEGTYRKSATFGQGGDLWANDHTGQDFSAAAGTPVMASKAGTVSVEASSWAGPNFVTIDHGDGLMTTYGHMQAGFVKTGDVVQPGQVIGEVGSEGNSTGPHLHFEVVVDGVKVDPMLFLDSGSGTGPSGWGGHANGMIPADQLCSLSGQSAHSLRCDAAAAWNALSKAYQRDFKAPMCITDSYRSYAGQVALYQTKPSLAAVPGTSNHGWGMAVDLCGGINTFGTPQFKWMTQNAPKFGWHHPSWARQGGGREEPWHWEFGRL